MHRWKTTDAEKAELLYAVNWHIPSDVDMGSPVSIMSGHLITDVNGSVGVMNVDQQGLHRYLVHPGGTIELSGWVQRQPIYHETVVPLSYEHGGHLVHLIDCDRVTAETLIAAITGHLPIGGSLGGRVRVVSPKALLVDYGDSAAVWGVDADGAWRQTDLSDGSRELVVWRDGAEVQRRSISAG